MIFNISGDHIISGDPIKENTLAFLKKPRPFGHTVSLLFPQWKKDESKEIAKYKNALISQSIIMIIFVVILNEFQLLLQKWTK